MRANACVALLAVARSFLTGQCLASGLAWRSDFAPPGFDTADNEQQPWQHQQLVASRSALQAQYREPPPLPSAYETALGEQQLTMPYPTRQNLAPPLRACFSEGRPQHSEREINAHQLALFRALAETIENPTVVRK